MLDENGGYLISNVDFRKFETEDIWIAVSVLGWTGKEDI